MQFFFSTVGAHNPRLASDLPQHMAHPISQRTDNGIDLDYSTLLLGQKYHIDTEVFELVTNSRQDFLAPMKYSLEKLLEADLLEKVDMKSLIQGNLPEIDKRIDHLLDDPLNWLHDARHQWDIVSQEFSDFHDKFGDPGFEKMNRGHFGVENWLAKLNEEDNEELRKQCLGLLNSRKTRLSSGEFRIAQGILEFLIAQVVITDFLRHKLQLPFLNWSDASPYYDRLYAMRWNDMSSEATVALGAQRLFNLVIPELKPGNVEQVIKFVQDNKAVESMRKTIIDAMNQGEEISQEWFSRYINEVFRNELENQKKTKKLRWFGTGATSLIPGGSLLGEVAMEVGSELIEDAIGAPKKDFRWYYTLQSSRSVS